MTPSALIGTGIKSALGIVGSIALAVFVYAGFLWLTSAGNAEQVQKGKTTMLYAAIGLVIVFSAYAIVKFILQDGLGLT